MKILLEKLSSKYDEYKDDILNYTIISQKTFSFYLFLFFVLYIILTNIIEYVDGNKFNPATWLCVLEAIISLVAYLLFKYYFISHKKFAIFMAYINIMQTIILLDAHFLLYSRYISFMAANCIIMATALTTISCGIPYFFCIAPIFTIDTIIYFYTFNNLSLRDILVYAMDNIFIVLFAVGIHMYFSTIKYEDFKLKHKLLYLSQNDSLTGLLNRNAVEKFVEDYSKSKNLSAMFILDIDNFKLLNDTLGHIKGDEALIDISKNLKEIFSNKECVARLGGDEFVIFIPSIENKEYSIEKARKILNTFPMDYKNDNITISLGCSIGIAFSKGPDHNLYDNLYKNADNAMYQVKKAGKNKIKIYNETGYIE